jgi:hypothetical protein
MLHKEFWGLVFLAFVVWIFFAADGQARIARTCRPLLWTGNIATSLTAFAVPSGTDSVQKWSNKLDYGCRYTVWRLIYQDDYNKAIQNQDPQTAPGAPTAPAAPTAVPRAATPPAGVTPAAVPAAN